MKRLFLFLVLFSIGNLAFSDDYPIFVSWIERTCKPFDKGKLTAFPHFNLVSIKLNKSAMLKFKDLPEVNSERWLSLEDLDGEKWIEMSEFNGNYSVSNYGRIKSKERIRKTYNNGIVVIKEHIMRLTLNKSHGGYWYASFHLKSKESSIKQHVHVLVAKYFVPNPHNFPCVNHKDENTRHNSSENLEWCTYAYNNSYGTARERAQRTRQEKGISKKVGCYDEDGNLVNKFTSLGLASRAVGVGKGLLSYYIRNNKRYKDGLYYKYI